ncbi:hypothetical protein PPUJ21368_20390 [Pseudomonas putida]|nr:hypothetical protein PPUJ21368_20390 [Pseudomonas putida]
MYMNSVNYFSQMKGEEATALRRDILEKNYLSLKSTLNGKQVGEFFAVIDGKEVSLGSEAVMNVDLPSPSNIFIFCMAALADGLDGRIPGEHAGQVTLSHRFAELGDHVLLIKDHGEFSKRLNAAILAHPYLYSSPFFEGGHGQVDYVDMKNHNGIVGLFRKDIEYAWQREYRICLGCSSEALNADGALELEIGDLSDITDIVPVEHFAAQTIRLKRGVFEKVEGIMRHRYTD